MTRRGGRRKGGEKKTVKLPNVDLALDRSGSARTMISNLPTVETPNEIQAELEFRDPNGEIQTFRPGFPSGHRNTLWGSNPIRGLPRKMI